LELEILLGGRIAVLRRRSGDIEEVDGTGCQVYLECTSDNALQIAFYPAEQSAARFVIRVRSGSKLMIVGDEEF
jgi:hypothetical protein